MEFYLSSPVTFPEADTMAAVMVMWQGACSSFLAFTHSHFTGCPGNCQHSLAKGEWWRWALGVGLTGVVTGSAANGVMGSRKRRNYLAKIHLNPKSGKFSRNLADFREESANAKNSLTKMHVKSKLRNKFPLTLPRYDSMTEHLE